MRKVFLDNISSYSLFFHISHHSIYLLCLDMICWLGLCIIEFSSDMFIMFWFVRFTFHFLFLISLFVGENSVISFSGVFMWSASLASISKLITGFFRFLGSKRSLWGNTSYLGLLRISFFLLYRNFHYLCYVLVLFVHLCYFCVLFVVCDFFDFGWEGLDFLLVAFCHGMLLSFSRLFI